MDHITVPTVTRTPAGVDAVMLEVAVTDGWVSVEPADVGGPAFTVDVCSWRRLVTAGARLGA